MSHDLRTPLNSILILSDLMVENADGRLGPKELEFAGTIQESGKELYRLIDDILDLSKIEEGKLSLEAQEVVLDEFAAAVERQFQPTAGRSELSFTVRTEGGLPPRIRTDGGRLGQIVRNLLSNAFKFTERGGVTFAVRRPDRADLEAAGLDLPVAEAVAFVIEDTGIGIPGELQDTVFEAFHQADGATNRRFGGTGLGLSISLHLARLLGGGIRLESAVGEGSRFTLVVPEVMPEDGYAADRQAGDDRVVTDAPVTQDAESNGGRLLPVDDDMRTVFAMCSVLEELGYQVETAQNGREALEKLDAEPGTGLILMDIMMPEMDGYEAMRRIRADAHFQRLPVIALTAKAMKEDRAKCLAAGASDYLSKPVDPDRLLAVLRQWLPGRASTRSA